MNDDEIREAERLRAYLDGEGPPPNAEDADTVGLLKASRPQAREDAAWERIKARTRPAAPSPWAWAGYAVAAAAVVALLVWPSQPPLPPGASMEQREAALEALDPASGPPLERLAALHRLAGAERARLVAKLERE